MKLIKKFFAVFSPVEIIVLLSAIVISTIVLIPSASNETPNYVIIFADEKIYSVNGGMSIDPFNTEFYVSYEDINEKTSNSIRGILNEYLVPYHKLFDRHHDYFTVAPVSPRNPTKEEVETLPRLVNLKYINEHKDKDLEIDEPLYKLLETSKEYTLNTDKNAFNMFIGGVYDFWVDLGISSSSYQIALDPLNNSNSLARVAELQSYVPLSKEEINDTLKLWQENNKYYVRFNDFNSGGDDLSISVGAVAKGMMLDILTNTLFAKGFNKGHVNGGQSSYGFLGKGPYGDNFKIKMTRIDENEDESSEQYAYQFSRPGVYQMSTSGIYAGKSFIHNGQKIVRSHIIDPLTGYPTQKEQYITNIVSNTLSGEELDYLTSTLTVLSIEDGIKFLQENYPEDDVQLAFVCVDNNTYYIRRSASFPGGEKASFKAQKEYGDFFLDLL